MAFGWLLEQDRTSLLNIIGSLLRSEIRSQREVLTRLYRVGRYVYSHCWLVAATRCIKIYAWPVVITKKHYLSFPVTMHTIPGVQWTIGVPTRVESSLKVVLQLVVLIFEILLVLVVLTTIHVSVLRMPLPTLQFVIMMSVTATNGFESYVIILTLMTILQHINEHTSLICECSDRPNSAPWARTITHWPVIMITMMAWSTGTIFMPCQPEWNCKRAGRPSWHSTPSHIMILLLEMAHRPKNNDTIKYCVVHMFRILHCGKLPFNVDINNIFTFLYYVVHVV